MLEYLFLIAWVLYSIIFLFAFICFVINTVKKIFLINSNPQSLNVIEPPVDLLPYVCSLTVSNRYDVKERIIWVLSSWSLRWAYIVSPLRFYLLFEVNFQG